jgi:hypothetical protein
MIGHPLPFDWEPSRDDVIYGRNLGLSDDQIADALEGLRLWAGANSNRAVARKSNWHMAFKSWMRREAAKRKSHAAGNPTIDAFDKIIDLTASNRIEGGPSVADKCAGSGQGGETTDWLFPPCKAAGP